ncbi:WD40/YVTN/BNR-like repeat-containing protein [Chloroflexota bacterium]
MPDGLLRIEKNCPDWDIVLKPEGVISTITSLGTNIWAGTDNGQIWHSPDRGNSWFQVQFPVTPSAVLALDAHSSENNSPVLVAAIASDGGRCIQVWRSANGGSDWNLWLEKGTGWKSIHKAIKAGDGFGRVLALGADCYIYGSEGWKISKPNNSDTLIFAMFSVPEKDMVFIAIGPDLYFRQVDGMWKPFNQGMIDVDITALSLSPQFDRDRKILALTVNGEVWERELD